MSRLDNVKMSLKNENNEKKTKKLLHYNYNTQYGQNKDTDRDFH